MAAIAEMSGVFAVTLLVGSLFEDFTIKYGENYYFIPHEVMVIIFSAIFIMRFIIASYGQREALKFCLNFSSEIKTRILNNIITQDFSKFLEKKHAHYIQVLTEVSSSFSNTFLMTLLKFCTDSLISISLLLYIGYSAPMLTLGAVCITAILYIAYTYGFRKYFERLGQSANIAAESSILVSSEAISGFKEIRLSGFENFFLSRLRRFTQKYASVQIAANSVRIYIKYGLETIIFLALALFLFSTLEPSESLENQVASIAALTYAGLRLVPLINQLFYSLSVLQYSKNSIDLIHLYLNQKAGTKVIPTVVSGGSAYLKAENVSLSFSSQPNLISEFSFKFEKGKIYAICGPSGVGKTSLLNVLAGLFMPTSGSVYYSTENEVADYSRLGSYLSQAPFLVNASVLDNITLGEPKKDFCVNTCKRLACLDEEEFHDHKEILVNNLSGGQRQRVGLARVLYGSGEFLFLDEPTSSLDRVTAEQIFVNLNKIKSEKCIIIVTHDEVFAEKYSDKIIYM